MNAIYAICCSDRVECPDTVEDSALIHNETLAFFPLEPRHVGLHRVHGCKCMVLQAVDDEGEPGASEDFGGGVLRKRAKASRQDKQADAEAAALQQVCPQQT